MPKKKKAKDGNKPSPWQDSRAKKLLRQDILDKTVVESMKPKAIFEMRPEYKPYGLVNFRSNYYSLRKSIKSDQGKADSDSAALAHDHLIHPVAAFTSEGYPRWEGSDAARLLKEDVNAGLHENVEPRVLRQTRPEYQAFPLKVFRDHIHQEVRSRTSRSYWMNRNKVK